MSTENRKTLLGSFAIMCDEGDCDVELVGENEADATLEAMTAGWIDIGAVNTKCPACAVGGSRKAQIQQLNADIIAFAQQAAGQPAPASGPAQTFQGVTPSHAPASAYERALESLRDGVKNEEDDDEKLELARKDPPDPVDAVFAMAPPKEEPSKAPEMIICKRRSKAKPEKEPFVPYEKRVGSTIPGVTESASAIDPDIARAKAAKERVEKRRQEQAKEANKNAHASTLAKMGGVEDLLNDFDGLFGNQSDPDKW